MKELIERIECAEGESAVLFREVQELVRPRPSTKNAITWSESRNLTAWHDRFEQLLAVEAWLSAVEMLVPEGCAEWNCEKWNTSGVYPKHVLATAWVKGAPRCYAATPALALAAAALKARTATAKDDR